MMVFDMCLKDLKESNEKGKMVIFSIFVYILRKQDIRTKKISD